MLTRFIALAALLAAASPAHAVVFTTTTPVTAVMGSPVSIDVSASQLYADQLGAYDVTATYNSALLSFNSIGFSNALGNPLTDAITSFTATTGAIEFAEVSFLATADLKTLQPARAFSLATLNFTALRSGAVTLSLGSIVVSDANGSALLVPEPASAALCLAMLGAVPLLRRRT